MKGLLCALLAALHAAPAAAPPAAAKKMALPAAAARRPADAARLPAVDGAAAGRLFNAALATYHGGDTGGAAAAFFDFLGRAPQGADNVAWAHHFLADCLEREGLPYAASVYYFMVAKARSEPEVLAETLGRLEAMARARPIDEELLYDGLIYDGDFGFLTPQLSSWVGTVQGTFDYLRHDVEWGDRRFRAVDPNSPYSLDVAYVKAVYAVREHRDNEALEMFRAIAASPLPAAATKNRSRLAVARLLFERGRYAEASRAYDQVQVQDLSYEEAQVLTERAWTAYYLADYPRALGLLHALAAPSYESFFFPDTYLLRALVYKELCHYLAAKSAVRAFRVKFGRTLELVKQRAPMVDNERLRRAATMEGPIARRTRLLQAMRRERQALGSWRGGPLQQHLVGLYDAALATHDRRWHHEFAQRADLVGLRLLDTLEQINVLDYEIGLDIYRPLDGRALAGLGGPTPEPELPDRALHDYYEFDGEYWNEELGDYRVTIASRCLGRP